MTDVSVRAPRADARFAGELEAHRAYLFRVAHLQLRDRAAADDVVQDTLVAALAGGFSGRSSLRTWLTGILKHKIVDAIRRRRRDPLPMADLGASDPDGDDFDALFDAEGAWAEAPRQWSSPDGALEQREFFDVLEVCLEKLPAATARVFLMREVLELDAEEICRELAITSNNLWVILYRARLALRMCLEQNWFGGTAPNQAA